MWPVRLTLYGCGCSSGVEHNLAKVGVEGSNPFARSNDFKDLRPLKLTARAGVTPGQQFLPGICIRTRSLRPLAGTSRHKRLPEKVIEQLHAFLRHPSQRDGKL